MEQRVCCVVKPSKIGYFDNQSLLINPGVKNDFLEPHLAAAHLQMQHLKRSTPRKESSEHDDIRDVMRIEEKG